MDYQNLQEFAADLDRDIDKWKARLGKDRGNVEALQLTYEALCDRREDVERHLLALRDAWCKRCREERPHDISAEYCASCRNELNAQRFKKIPLTSREPVALAVTELFAAGAASAFTFLDPWGNSPETVLNSVHEFFDRHPAGHEDVSADDGTLFVILPGELQNMTRQEAEHFISGWTFDESARKQIRQGLPLFLAVADDTARGYGETMGEAYNMALEEMWAEAARPGAHVSVEDLQDFNLKISSYQLLTQ